MSENSLPELYELTSVEQMRALADTRRLQIMNRLGFEAMTATQLGVELGLSTAKAHYHVRELERVSLVRIVETREKGGILEKYYRAIAQSISVPQELLRASPDGEVRDSFKSILQQLVQELSEALTRFWQKPEKNPARTLFGSEILWMTNEELQDLAGKLEKLLAPYRRPGTAPEQSERVFAHFSYPLPRLSAAASGTEQPQPKARHLFATGIFSYKRQELEELVERHEALDLRVAGMITFAPDISAELIDRAILRFRFFGVIDASREVREALKKKEKV